MFRSPVTPGGKRITRKDTARTQFCCCLFAFFALTPCGRKRCMIRTLLKHACSRGGGGRKPTRPAAPKIDTWHARKRFGQKNLRDSAKRLVWGTLTSLTRATPPPFSVAVASAYANFLRICSTYDFGSVSNLFSLAFFSFCARGTSVLNFRGPTLDPLA